jgi:predicted kinase
MKYLLHKALVALAPSKTLYVVRGISGRGKTSTAKALTPWNVASDDYPDLYVDGVYQVEMQSASHEWCFAKVEAWLKQGKKKVAVHNTFVKIKYLESFVALAATYGYVVQIIHAEAVILPSGRLAENLHGVTPEILERQSRSFETFNIK